MLLPPPAELRSYVVFDLPHDAPSGVPTAEHAGFVPRPVVRQTTPPPRLSTTRKLTLLAPAAMLAVLGVGGAAVVHELSGGTDVASRADRTRAGVDLQRVADTAGRTSPVSRSADRTPVVHVPLPRRHHAGVPQQRPGATAPGSPAVTPPTTAPTPGTPTDTHPTTHGTSHSTGSTSSAAESSSSSSSTASTTPTKSQSTSGSTTSTQPSTQPSTKTSSQPSSQPSTTPTTTQTPSPAPSDQQGPVGQLLDPILDPVLGILGG